jgi:hypothetical protein
MYEKVYAVPTDLPTERNAPWIYLSALVIVIIFVSRLAAIIDAPDVWLDEAMLMDNLPLESISAAFLPLPQNAQAAPPGYLIMASGVVAVLGDQQHHGLRLLSLAGSLGAAAFLLLALIRLNAAPVAPVALALVFLSPFGVRYGIEIKQYSFELMAASLLLYATIRASQSIRTADLVVLAGSGVFAILFSFAAPLLIAGFAAGLAVTVLLDRLPTKASIARHAPLGVMAILVLLSAVWHFKVTSALTAINFITWAEHYQTAYLDLRLPGQNSGVSPKGYLSIMLGMFDPYYRMSSGYYAHRSIAVAGTLLLLVGLITCFRSMPLITVSCLALMGGIAVLSALKLYPILYTRHFICIQPIVGIVIAVGIAATTTLLARATRFLDEPSARVGAGILLVLGYGYVSLEVGMAQEKNDLTGALAVIEDATGTEDALVLVSPSAVPAMNRIAPSFKTQIQYDPDQPAEYAVAVGNYDQIWVIETLVYDDDMPGLNRSLAAFETRFGTCREVYRSGSNADLGYTLVYRCG